MNDLRQSISSSLSRRSFLESDISSISSQYLFEKEEEKRIQESVELNTKALSIMSIMYEKLNAVGLNELTRLMTESLRTMFPDRDYEVYYEVTDERGVNNLNFYLREKREDGVIESNLKSEVGGGVRATVGLTCLVFYILRMNGERFIVFDEALSQLADEYILNLFGLLKSFAEQAKFKFLLITHDQRFKSYLDVEYTMKEDGKLWKN